MKIPQLINFSKLLGIFLLSCAALNSSAFAAELSIADAIAGVGALGTAPDVAALQAAAKAIYEAAKALDAAAAKALQDAKDAGAAQAVLDAATVLQVKTANAVIAAKDVWDAALVLTTAKAADAQDVRHTLYSVAGSLEPLVIEINKSPS